jgi:hypothetical protein
MAKKSVVVKNEKTKKATTTGQKPVVKTVQTKAAVTRKPAAAAKPPAKPITRNKLKGSGSNCFHCA